MKPKRLLEIVQFGARKNITFFQFLVVVVGVVVLFQINVILRRYTLKLAS